MLKILNLYAGIGGNRKLWGNNFDITAVEINEKIAYTENIPSGGSSHVTFRKSGKEKITLVATQKPLKKYLVRLIKEAING